MTKIIIQTIDESENVISQSERVLHSYEECPRSFYLVYEQLIEEHQKKNYIPSTENN